jgi:hypothetical protein
MSTYIATGDGGGANDAGEGHIERAAMRNTTTLLGKMLRITSRTRWLLIRR